MSFSFKIILVRISFFEVRITYVKFTVLLFFRMVTHMKTKVSMYYLDCRERTLIIKSVKTDFNLGKTTYNVLYRSGVV